MIFLYNNNELTIQDLVDMKETPFTRYNKELNYLICKDSEGKASCRFRMNGLTPELILDTLNDLLNIYNTDIVLKLKEEK